MKRSAFILALLFAALTFLSSFTSRPQGEQQKSYALYGVAFYNVENLFDTLHDAGKNDYEFLPGGS